LQALQPDQVVRALDGDQQAMRALVRRMLPAVQTEVGYSLLRDARTESRDPRQEIRDFVQEVLVSLLAQRGKVLRSWDPARGRSFESFVRLVARRRVAAILRSARHSPWADESVPGDELDDEVAAELTLAEQVEARDTLAQLLDSLERRLDERGMLLFRLLYVEGRSAEEVMRATGMTRDAVYAWRLRFRKLAESLTASA
jgi:RNA polymerase sigma factor (sigma-70 family)